MKYTEDRKTGDIVPTNEKVFNHLQGMVSNEKERIKATQGGIKDETHFDDNFFSFNGVVEIKTETYSIMKKTGNHFIEYSAKYPERENFIQSGIETTGSPYWLLSSKLDDETYLPVSLLIQTQHLKDIVDKCETIASMRTGVLPTGDVNEGWLIPIVDILKPYLDTIPPYKLAEYAVIRQNELNEEEVRKQQQIKQRLNELNSQRIKEALNKK
jgi:hypothetical protein